MIATSAGCHQLGRHRPTCVSGCVPAVREPVAPLRTLWRVFRLAGFLGALFPIVVLIAAIPGYSQQRRRSTALRLLCRSTLSALDVTVRIRGLPRSGPSLVVANHTSWLDVLVLGAAANVVPVAKAEVAAWPMIGGVAQRCGAVFLSRRAWRGLRSAVDQMTLLMRQGHRVQIFPEATTRCGRAVGEFYRAGFQAALDAGVVVQPAALTYSRGESATSATAFVGDDNLLDALRRLLRMGAVTAELSWLNPIPAVAGTGRAHIDRAVVATLCQNAVARALRQSVVARRRAAAFSVEPSAIGDMTA